MGGPRGHLDDGLHRSGDIPPMLLVTCTIACVCSAPHYICLDFHLWSPTNLAPKLLPFWEAGLPASVMNLLHPRLQGGPLPLAAGSEIWPGFVE